MPVISGVDMQTNPTRQKRFECRARAAREWFALNGPRDLQPLPLGYAEREELKAGGAPHILAWYARSLACRDYVVEEHPSFDDYACGVMASEFGWDTVKHDIELQRRFPPRHLNGLGPGLIWLPPKEHADEMEIHRRSQAWAASYAARQDELRTQE